MQILTGAGPRQLDEDQVPDTYPWPSDRRWFRAMMVTTLDGAAVGPNGLSGSISSSADQAVFNAVRRHADVVLVGAGTIRAEHYNPLRPRPADQDARRAAGQAPAPLIVVLSHSLELPWEDPLFNVLADPAETAGQPLVVTTGATDPDRVEGARTHAEVLVLPGEAVDLAMVLDELAGRGLTRVVCEGGPSLLGEAIASGLVDEADITISPVFSGNAASPRVAMLTSPARFELAQVIEQDGFLMNRYLRTTDS